MIDLTPHDKRVLSTVGRNSYGTELVQIMQKVRAQVSSLDGLTPGEDHNAAVEGRLLFKEFADIFIDALTTQKKPATRRGEDDFT